MEPRRRSAQAQPQAHAQPHALALALALALASAHAPARAASLEVRDPFGLPNLRTSDRFAVHWGDAGGVTLDEVDALLAALDRAWAVQVDEMGHPPPPSTATAYFDVYVGDSGDGAPSSYGADGYYTLDDDGYPMLVVAASALDDPDLASHTASHELYHALQTATGRFARDGAAAWFWEATAEWAAVQTAPDNPANGPFVYAYALQPALPVVYAADPRVDPLGALFPYGAFLFPLDLTRAYGFELVRDAWTEAHDPDPLETMRAWLADRGGDLDEAWLDHLATRIALDYDQGALYAANVAQNAARYPELDPFAVHLSGPGGDGAISGDDPRAPARYGSAAIVVERPDAGLLSARFSGQTPGADGAQARFGGRVVVVARDGAASVTAIPFDGADGGVEVRITADDARVYAVIGALPPDEGPVGAVDPDARFGVTWSVSVTPDDPAIGPAPRSDAGSRRCGCAAGPATRPPVGLLALLAGLRTRCRRASTTS